MEVNFVCFKTEGQQLFFAGQCPCIGKGILVSCRYLCWSFFQRRLSFFFFEFLFEYFASPYASEPRIKWLQNCWEDGFSDGQHWIKSIFTEGSWLYELYFWWNHLHGGLGANDCCWMSISLLSAELQIKTIGWIECHCQWCEPDGDIMLFKSWLSASDGELYVQLFGQPTCFDDHT